MMKARKLVDDVYWVGAVDWDRRIFDSLVPIPEGTSYNAFVVRGSKATALVDTVDPEFWPVLSRRLDDLNVKLDVVVVNHAEQDHSGCLPHVLSRFPEARVVCTPKAKGMLADHLGIPDSPVEPVADGERLDLGGVSLQFVHFPWVHWPETMLTYVPERRLLLPCDLFGSHLATNDLVASDAAELYRCAKLYYAEIMMPFADKIAKNLSKLDGLEIDVIAPSHGPASGEPQAMVDAYRSWTSGPPKNQVVIPYISMHHSTRLMVDHLIEGLSEHSIKATRLNLERLEVGKLAVALVDAATVVLGTPTVLMAAHPNVLYAAHLFALLKPKVQNVGVIGSFGWGGRAVEQITGALGKMQVELLDPVMARGMPNDDTYSALDSLAETIAEKHATL